MNQLSTVLEREKQMTQIDTSKIAKDIVQKIVALCEANIEQEKIDNLARQVEVVLILIEKNGRQKGREDGLWLRNEFLERE